MSDLASSQFITIFLFIVIFCSPIFSERGQKININPFVIKELGLEPLINNTTGTWLLTAERIANILIEMANKTTNGWYWRKVLNFPDSAPEAGTSQFYPGYFFGTAGIGDQFLELYLQSGNITYLQVAEQAALSIIHQSKEKDQRIHWTRSVDSSVVYTGKKYGYAGILQFLLNIYSASKNSIYLNISCKLLDTLIFYSILDEKSGGVYWGYNVETAEALTDLTYGAAGIGEAFLRAYEITGNQTYLDFGIKAAKWIQSLAIIKSSGSSQQISYYSSTNLMYHYNYTGLLGGSAGIGTFFLELYKLTNKAEYLENAVSIGRWLTATMHEGIWKFNAPDLLTDIGNFEGTFLSNAVGSSGIGQFFLLLYDSSNISYFLYPVNKIIDKLYSSVIVHENQLKWKTQIEGTNSDKTFTGLGFGAAGIGLFFANILSYFGNYRDVLSVLSGIDAFLRASQDRKTGLIPYLILSTNKIVEYHSDFLNGLAGIMKFYMEVNLAINKPLPKYNLNIIEAATVIGWNFVEETKNIDYNHLNYFLLVLVTIALRKKKIKS